MTETETVTPATTSPRVPWVASKRAKRAKGFDLLFSGLTFLSGWGTVALLVLIGLEVGYAALPAMRQFGFHFLVSTDWDPVNDQYGALPLIYGTMVSAALALLISTPLGVAIALFLTEDYLHHRLRSFFKFLASSSLPFQA